MSPSAKLERPPGVIARNSAISGRSRAVTPFSDLNLSIFNPKQLMKNISSFAEPRLAHALLILGLFMAACSVSGTANDGATGTGAQAGTSGVGGSAGVGSVVGTGGGVVASGAGTGGTSVIGASSSAGTTAG